MKTMAKSTYIQVQLVIKPILKPFAQLRLSVESFFARARCLLMWFFFSTGIRYDFVSEQAFENAAFAWKYLVKSWLKLMIN